MPVLPAVGRTPSRAWAGVPPLETGTSTFASCPATRYDCLFINLPL